MHFKTGKFICLLILYCFISSLYSYGQEEGTTWQQGITDLLAAEQYDKADSLLNRQQSIFLKASLVDSLYQFPGFIGRITDSRAGANAAAKKAEDFVSFLKTKTTNHRTLFKTYLNLDKLYVYLGDDENALSSSIKALEFANQLSDVTPEELGKINYAIGGNYYALYDLSNALTYFKNSASSYEKSKAVKKDILADAYNGVAAAMWTLNKLDSAHIYYNKAIASTKESELTGYDRIYYIVAFQFNLALVIDAQGRLSEAIALKKEIIPQLQDIIDHSQDEALVKKAKRLLASAVSNLAAFYNDTGYVSKAYEMLQYSYEKKKEVYDLASPRMATALTQIALAEFELKEFDKSIKTSELALENLKKSPSRYLPVEADIYAVLAKSYEAKGDYEQTNFYYEKSRELFNKAYPEAYSQEYLILLKDYTQFLADQNKHELALDISKSTYDYILKNGGENNFPILKEITNLSEVYYKAKDYSKAHEWAEKGNRFLDMKLADAKSDYDSVQIEFRRPAITLLEVRSLYELNPSRDTLFIKEQLQRLNKAVAALERRKTTTFKPKDVTGILAEYRAVNSLAKKLNYELYQQTSEDDYISKTISLHESGIYNRIRTQFNMKNNIKFRFLPDSVITKEKSLRNNLSTSLSDSSGNQLNNYFNATEEWKQFLNVLKEKYPKYYKLRYETIEEDLGDLQQTISENTSVVRYLYIEDNLFAFVLNRTSKEMLALNNENVKDLIAGLAENQSELDKTATSLNLLHDQLWKPLEHLVTTPKVVIIPDRELFNLSFETLTPLKISKFGELATNSLLAKHQISYNYSLFLLKQPVKSFDYKNNFVAFAPEFNEEMKVNYRFSIKDSLEIDKTYIKLLPQPFSAELVQEYSAYFDGKSYLNEKSTKQVFKQNAKEHKIIHIGTHAESNNLTPQFSRLIFAKDISEAELTEDNSLFTYEIYDYNLASNLTILTACETGKPTFEPGEGMISLAHAFNYAGSESILTSLWKIDEKSSSEILDYFYENIKEGMSKDEALQKAKLTYIETAEGRTIAPQYWAGLVLMGDTQPIELKTSFPFWPWFIGGLILLALMLIVFRKRNPTK
jgi:CHAT domain-containing protein